MLIFFEWILIFLRYGIIVSCIILWSRILLFIFICLVLYIVVFLVFLVIRVFIGCYVWDFKLLKCFLKCGGMVSI